MILIDAVYINNSGGKVLLEYFIESIFDKKIQDRFFFLLDARLVSDKVDLLPAKNIRVIHPAERERKLIYKGLTFMSSAILCFGNVPPPLKFSEIPVFIYFQNSLLLDTSQANHPLKTRVMFFIKRTYIKYQSLPQYNWIVQTKGMKELLVATLKVSTDHVKILPFYKSHSYAKLNLQLDSNKHRFLYVANGADQKNHIRLLQAWKILSETSDFPLELHLTIPSHFKDLLKIIDEYQKQGCLIQNHGYCSFSEISYLYSICNYFIFPSLTESFGLPLIEAASAGCQIISADLPYVFDVVKPLTTFNPYKVSSIVNAVLQISVMKQSERSTAILVNNEINQLLSLIQGEYVYK